MGSIMRTGEPMFANLGLKTVFLTFYLSLVAALHLSQLKFKVLQHLLLELNGNVTLLFNFFLTCKQNLLSFNKGL